MVSIPSLTPWVSVLLPARNEVGVIQTVIQSLQNQDYPRFEVWIGNDGSTDGTAERVQELIRHDARFHVIDIPPDPTGQLQGKTQALQVLGQQAQGEILLMTDADMDLPPSWISAYVATFEQHPDAGVVVGTTLVKQSVWQSLEWLWVLQGLALVAPWGWPTTGMGNNMGVRSSAWSSVNGFEQIGFSLVEDYALYHQIVQVGYGFAHVFSPAVLGWTLPPENLMEQRNRWIRGAWKTRSPWLVFAFTAVLWLPFLFIFCWVSPVWGQSLLCLTWLFGLGWGVRGTHLLRWHPGWGILVVAPLVLPLRLLRQLAASLRQPAVVWKGRRYPS